MIWVEGNSLLICFDAGNRRSLEPQEGLSSLRRRCNKNQCSGDRKESFESLKKPRCREKMMYNDPTQHSWKGSNLSKCRQLCLLGSWNCLSRCHLHKIHRCPERTSDRLSEVYWFRGIHLDWHSYFSSFKLNMLLVYDYIYAQHRKTIYLIINKNM